MGDPAHPRQSPPTFRPLVAFDFDGTLTSRDSFTAFLAWRAGRVAYAAGMAALASAGIGFLADRDRGRLKAAAVKRFLGGVPKSQLEAEAQTFATEQGRLLLRPDAVRAWRKWQSESGRMVIVTASPEIIVAPIA